MVVYSQHSGGKLKKMASQLVKGEKEDMVCESHVVKG
jgi:hypothetical protein